MLEPYKSGDEIFISPKGVQIKRLLYLLPMARTVSIKAHSLPSARGQDDTYTGRISLEKDANIGFNDHRTTKRRSLLIASDAATGFGCSTEKSFDAKTKRVRRL